MFSKFSKSVSLVVHSTHNVKYLGCILSFLIYSFMKQYNELVNVQISE